MKKIILFLSIISFNFINIQAQEIKVSVPNAVENNSSFRLIFELKLSTGNNIIRNFRLNGDLDPSLDVLSGPVSNMNLNGTMTYTYVIKPNKEGTYKIPSATVIINDKTIQSGSAEVKVVPASQQSKIHNASGVNVFVRVIPSKTTVYEQEAVVLTYKLYAKGVNVVGISAEKFPESKGFLSYDVDLPQEKQFISEDYDNQVYSTIVLKQSVLFPQQAGELNIDKGEFNVRIRIRNNNNPFGDPFFDNFLNTYQDVERKIESPTLKINVKPFPSGKPKFFANVAGDFKLESGINTTNLKVNEPITIKVDISGNGNLRLIKNPEIVFPPDFEIYDPKVDNRLKTTAAGVTGTRSIEYLAIPRHSGKFTIPEAEFGYFDVKTKSYKILKTKSFTVNVEKGDGTNASAATVVTGINKEEVKLLGSDIRFIDTKHFKLKPKADFLFGSVLFVLCYLIPLLAAIVLFIVFRKQARNNADIALMRNKKANKIASKRLKLAHKYLQEGAKEKFYDEVLKALWGYFSDKLNIPLASLTKDNIEAELSNAGVDDALITELKNILSTCEYARYAPGGEPDEMDKLYNLTIEKMSKLEGKIKR